MSTVIKTESHALSAYTTTGDLVEDGIYEDIDKETLQYLVENYPRNSFGVFYNKMFEEDNFIFVLNGLWYFFDADAKVDSDVFALWNWNTDVPRLESYCSDSDEMNDFHNGWTYVSADEFIEGFYDEMVRILSKPDSDMIQLALPKPNCSDTEVFYKRKVKQIVSDSDLTDDEKTEKLFEIFTNRKNDS